MNRKKLFALNILTIMKIITINQITMTSKIFQLDRSRKFLKCLIFTLYGLMFSNFLHAKLAWMPLVCYIPNNTCQVLYICIWFHFCFIAYQHIWQFISICSCFICDQCLPVRVRGRAGRACDSKSRDHRLESYT